ncbi:MAG: SBBP repeat-containing protein [Dissulfurispiraceae bacterium]
MKRRLMSIPTFFYLSIGMLSALLLLSLNDACAYPNTTSPGSTKSKVDNNLLQFAAGHHILGFAPSKAYIASLDHALTIEFLGTKGVMPKTEGDAPDTRAVMKAQSLRKVVYENLWDGISVTYEPTKNGITESTYHIAAGADVSKIRLKYNVPFEKQQNGSLSFKFEKGNLTESAPIAWQEIDGKRIPVTVAFKVSGDEVELSVGGYDHTTKLIIDPTYSWNTFYGSGNADYGAGMAVDSSGNVYVTGQSYGGTWNGPNGQGPLNAFSGFTDIFVLKLNSSGAYQWHTFYGSDYENYGIGIAVDSGGNVYVTGESYGGTWNGPGNALPLNPYNGSYYDIFVLKLNSSGTYQWHTFYGSGYGDIGNGIVSDGKGNVYVTGQSGETWNGPNTCGMEGNSPCTPLNPFSGIGNIFVLKLNSSGTYQWHTFYGSSNDIGNGVAVDSSGNVDITGSSLGGTWYGPTGQHPLNSYNGNGSGWNIFVLQLDSSGLYQWHTFYGSGNGDQARSVAVDSSGSVYVTGSSYGGTWGAPLNLYIGSGGIFVLKLNSSGSDQWNTFYGSGIAYNSDVDYGNSLAIDGGGSVYVTGYSYATWNGPSTCGMDGNSPCTPLNSFNGSPGTTDIFALKLDSSGAYQWHTFYGSGYGDEGAGIKVDVSGNVDVTGYSSGTWNGPSTCGMDGNSPCTPLNSFSGSPGTADIFVLQLQLSTCSPTAVRIQGTDIVSNALQTVYGEASSGDTIMIQALVLTEDLLMNLPIDVTLQGGYECDFPSAPPGRSTINGSLTIKGGAVTVENLIVQ